jgi:signal peptidase I
VPISGWVVAAAALVPVAAILGTRRRFTVVTVVGGSMEPTYRDGDRVLVSRGRRPTVGAVVVLRQAELPGPAHPSAATRSPLLLKRVTALPGDAVPAEVAAAVRDAGPGSTVPTGFLVVLGDAPTSVDSRAWGYLPLDQVAGVVVANLPAARG